MFARKHSNLRTEPEPEREPCRCESAIRRLRRTSEVFGVALGFLLLSCTITHVGVLSARLSGEAPEIHSCGSHEWKLRVLGLSIYNNSSSYCECIRVRTQNCSAHAQSGNRKTHFHHGVDTNTIKSLAFIVCVLSGVTSCNCLERQELPPENLKNTPDSRHLTPAPPPITKTNPAWVTLMVRRLFTWFGCCINRQVSGTVSQ